MKIGRNDPCPCGSGKKFKYCCGKAGAAPEFDLPDLDPSSIVPADPRRLERGIAQLHRLLEQHGDESIDELNQLLEDVIATGELPAYEPETPLERARELMYEAYDAEGRQRVTLARQALEVSPDCADAYVLLAEESATTAERALELYRQGAAAGERALGSEFLEAETSNLWGFLEARPYLRALLGEAQALAALARMDEAIDLLWELLRLNRGDNQGVRYLLLPALLERGDWSGARKLLARYREDIAAAWAYGRALLAFQQQGDSKQARRQLDRAIEKNPNVPLYLLGIVPMPPVLPTVMGIGDEREAEICVDEQYGAWQAIPGALAWLAGIVAERTSPNHSRPR